MCASVRDEEDGFSVGQPGGANSVRVLLFHITTLQWAAREGTLSELLFDQMVASTNQRSFV